MKGDDNHKLVVMEMLLLPEWFSSIDCAHCFTDRGLYMHNMEVCGYVEARQSKIGILTNHIRYTTKYKVTQAGKDLLTNSQGD